MNLNFQQQLDKLIEQLKEVSPQKSLLLHSCCGPCSSYVLEYLCQHFKTTVLYYNPNIYPKEEYMLRKEHQIFLIEEYKKLGRDISFLDCDYNYSDFLAAAKGFELVPEGGVRCEKCFDLRMKYTARVGKEMGFDFFGTTLTVSPHKNSKIINQIGAELSGEMGIEYLVSDFKKKGGYLRSVELAKQYGLYRQHYCGCGFSARVDEVE